MFRTIVGCAALIAFACLFVIQPAFTDESPNVNGKVAVHTAGPNQGMWIEDQTNVMALVTYLKENNEACPYVCVYLKDATGKMPAMPYALTMRQNELTLQIPTSGDTKAKAQLISMSQVVKALRDAKVID